MLTSTVVLSPMKSGDGAKMNDSMACFQQSTASMRLSNYRIKNRKNTARLSPILAENKYITCGFLGTKQSNVKVVGSYDSILSTRSPQLCQRTTNDQVEGRAILGMFEHLSWKKQILECQI